MAAATRWAMVGTGGMLRLIGRDFARTENAELRVIVSRSRERAEAAAVEYGIPEGSDDFGAVLARDDIDAVYVATPHSHHFEFAAAALESGKHVLVEKSMTTSAKDTAALLELARNRGLFAMEAMWSAFNPVIAEARRRVNAGVIGDARLIQATFSNSVPYSPHSRLWAPELAGGSTLDQGVYAIALTQFFLGTPSSITAKGTTVEGVDGEVVAILEWESGARAVLLTGLLSYGANTAFVGGSDGVIEFERPFWAPPSFRQRVRAESRLLLDEEFSVDLEGSGYVPMIRAASASIAAGDLEHPLRSHADTIAAAETMEEILRQVG